MEAKGDAKIVDLHVWRVGPEHHAGIVSVAAKSDVTAEIIRSRLTPVHELSHLTIEVREVTA